MTCLSFPMGDAQTFWIGTPIKNWGSKNNFYFILLNFVLFLKTIYDIKLLFFSLLKVELWWQRYLNVLQTILWVMIIFVILWYSLCTTDKWINGCIYVKTSLTPMAILKAQIYILTTLHQNPLTNNCWQNKLLVIVPSLNRVWLWPPWTAAHDTLPSFTISRSLL